MSKKRPARTPPHCTPHCTARSLLHVTRQEGRVTHVSREIVFSGPMDVSISDGNGGWLPLGQITELRGDVPIYPTPTPTIGSSEHGRETQFPSG